jgi:predicted amidohydrolase
MTTENSPPDSRPGISRRRILQGAAALATAAPLAVRGAANTPTSQPSQTLRARAVNFKPIQHDNPACAAKIRSVIETAAVDGVNLIVFPEMALQGFETCQDCADRGRACDRHLATGELADGPLMRELAELVRRRDMYAVIGFGERDPVKPLLYNAAAMLGPEGLIGTNRKMGVGTGVGWAHGQSMFSPGDAISVFPTRYGPLGLGICYDIWMNPEVARVMVLKGARILAIPTATVSTTKGGDIEQMAFTRARENVVFVINANLVGGGFEGEVEGEPRYYSHSYIAGPQYPSMARILGRTDDPFDVVTADIDLAQYDRYQSFMKFRERRLADGYDGHISQVLANEYAAYVGKNCT